MLNNALEGLLFTTSAETPSQLDIYSIHETLKDRKEVTNTTNMADLSEMEKAYIASQIAARNELDEEIQKDVVSFLFFFQSCGYWI